MNSSMVERLLVKQRVKSSNLFSSAKMCVPQSWKVVTVGKTVASLLSKFLVCRQAESLTTHKKGEELNVGWLGLPAK
jgi:hypothetical protein